MHHVSPCLIIVHHSLRGMKDSDNQLQKCRDLSCFKLLLVIGLWDIILTSLLPIQSCSSKFWAWSCIASNFDKGWRGDHKHKIMDRPFMPKYGTVSQVLLQLCVAYSNAEALIYRGSLVKETVKYISRFKWWKHYLATDTKINIAIVTLIKMIFVF